MEAVKLAIVVPCFNESEGISNTVQVLSEILNELIVKTLISTESFLLFVDDGSTDSTFSILNELKSTYVRIIKLTTNCGHQNALLAGLHYVYKKVDCCISIDSDLQDDLSVVEKMIIKFKNGNHIVCGVRDNRSSDTLFKKNSAKIFYWMMKKFNVELIENHADFRLLSNRALSELLKYKEYNLFLRGIFTNINLRICTISYTQAKRRHGTSKYNLRKMCSLAIHGITSFSVVPIRLITMLGILIFIICLLLSANVLITFLLGNTVPGWASITLPLYFLGGIQILSLGIIGEYISKTYMETKGRPHYHIEEIIE
ncbi:MULTISPECIES: glycosyltransferase family 2 protein [unclassified Sphingobacterium]|uniref:glycosyltransferase family 2 protein n=1 Tax=unclassified Sphingobacterium TaxID=2609468 RepID=UPI00104A0E0B|nr:MULTISPECIES: glycosyltransferase family 2 protein [unclassified Sphingobacterium]MCS3554733.1 glycosyltransferase involved in cell wall biosynthesis [Sphingobacterium sp. JUb21]TCR07720.1 glycosyltransferase involved in cell wall biosynthesis [Sphingobacterium sp. JUb20]